MYNVSFADITALHISGRWSVLNRFLSQASAADPVSVANQFFFDESNTLQLDTQWVGRWSLRNQELMNRPYLELELSGTPTQALITRYSSNPDTNEDRLYLYFDTGIEMILTRKEQD